VRVEPFIVCTSFQSLDKSRVKGRKHSQGVSNQSNVLSLHIYNIFFAYSNEDDLLLICLVSLPMSMEVSKQQLARLSLTMPQDE
jgi:hypothetical protein